MFIKFLEISPSKGPSNQFKRGVVKKIFLEKTGHTVGLDNVSISIQEGETFVCMGLSGSGKVNS